MLIQRLTIGDEAQLERVTCFDNRVRAADAKRFLESPTHHILVALDDQRIVGFVTGVETTHPDKGTEMFLYELAVDEAYRRQGCGTQLVQALADFARERGCYGMWVLVDVDNTAGRATYEAAGGSEESRPVMYGWTFAKERNPGA